MKKIFILFIVLNSFAWTTSQKASAQSSVSFQVFYDDLSPYGYWVDNSDYGYVWVPDVESGFTPYGTNGDWVYTDAGWTWVSNYPWGWAPFHYGRWYYDSMYGHIWIPGNEWGPGWVSWRVSDGYYGWTPIGPGISIDIAYSSGYYVPNNQWIFVRDRDFGNTNISNYYINYSNNTEIINNTTVINNIHRDNSGNGNYNTGPNIIEVEKHRGNKINTVAIKESNKPGQNMSNNQLQIYKPQVKNNDNNEKKPAPSKIVNLKDVKPIEKKNAEPIIKQDNKPAEQKPTQQQNSVKPEQKPSQQHNTVQPGEQKPTQQQNSVKPEQKPSQQQNTAHPAKEKPTQQQNNVQPAKEKPSQQQNTAQPAKQKPSQQQNNVQPAKQRPSQQQNTVQPAKQKPPQQQNTIKPANQKTSQPKQTNPSKNNGGEKPKH